MKLYLLDLGEGLDERTFREWSGMVSEERLNALPRFLFRADAERTLAGEILARVALSSAVSIPPSEIRFVRGELWPAGGLPPPRPLSAPAAFTLIWALKESYLKALGTGLCDDLPGIDLAAFVVAFDAEPWKFSFKGHLFRAFFHKKYAVSVCEKL